MLEDSHKVVEAINCTFRTCSQWDGSSFRDGTPCDDQLRRLMSYELLHITGGASVRRRCYSQLGRGGPNPPTVDANK
jgi:hypothetical protein